MTASARGHRWSDRPTDRPSCYPLSSQAKSLSPPPTHAHGGVRHTLPQHPVALRKSREFRNLQPFTDHFLPQFLDVVFGAARMLQTVPKWFQNWEPKSNHKFLKKPAWLRNPKRSEEQKRRAGEEGGAGPPGDSDLRTPRAAIRNLIGTLRRVLDLTGHTGAEVKQQVSRKSEKRNHFSEACYICFF